MSPGVLPRSFSPTRDALHQLAFFVLAPARYLFEEKMGLRPTRNGFSTPWLGEKVLRVEDDLLVVETVEGVAARTITTVADAADFFGVTYRTVWFEGFRHRVEPYPPDRHLDIDVSSVQLIGDLFAQGERVLERFGELVPGEITEIQLWPEHFDLAVGTGDQGLGEKATFGVSPGDAAHPLPYFYVSAWGEIDRSDPYWNDDAFNGASLSYRALIESAHPEITALEFLVEGYRAIQAH